MHMGQTLHHRRHIIVLAVEPEALSGRAAPRIVTEDHRAGRTEQQLADATPMSELHVGVLAQQANLGEISAINRLL
ncbi:hypothetical protein HP436_13075 [Pseudomonas sp. CrR14]|nr:hypothetical protein [Pseudomonas sp. CrR14]